MRNSVAQNSEHRMSKEKRSGRNDMNDDDGRNVKNIVIGVTAVAREIETPNEIGIGTAPAIVVTAR